MQKSLFLTLLKNILLTLLASDPSVSMSITKIPAKSITDDFILSKLVILIRLKFIHTFHLQKNLTKQQRTLLYCFTNQTVFFSTLTFFSFKKNLSRTFLSSFLKFFFIFCTNLLPYYYSTHFQLTEFL